MSVSPVCKVRVKGLSSAVAVCLKLRPESWACITLISELAPKFKTAASESKDKSSPTVASPEMSKDVSVPRLVMLLWAAPVTVAAVPDTLPVTLPVKVPAKPVAVTTPVLGLYVKVPSDSNPRLPPSTSPPAVNIRALLSSVLSLSVIVTVVATAAVEALVTVTPAITVLSAVPLTVIASASNVPSMSTLPDMSKDVPVNTPVTPKVPLTVELPVMVVVPVTIKLSALSSHSKLLPDVAPKNLTSYPVSSTPTDTVASIWVAPSISTASRFVVPSTSKLPSISTLPEKSPVAASSSPLRVTLVAPVTAPLRATAPLISIVVAAI